MKANPVKRNQLDLEREGFSLDSAQQQAVKHLQDLYQRLIDRHEQAPTRWASWVAKLAHAANLGDEKTHLPVRGLYFWGGVGRGKTYLMDIFFESLPFRNKMRVHFHRFMRRIHQELKNLKGQKNPLEIVAQRLSMEAQVICFDEFFVSDITDAMILATLLKALFERGVSLVATSNIDPDGLYKDGLQRSRFLPAIELIKTHTLVVNVDGGIDYRLRALEQAELYHCPLNVETDKSLYASFESLVPDHNEIRSNVLLDIENRVLCATHEAEDVVLFEFKELCDGPRSQNDYIELAREYHAVVVANVPRLGTDTDDQARRFISMIDEFYDRNVKLVVSAAQPLERIYDGSKLSFEFERTTSRLLEMQSHNYLAKPHKA